MTTEANSVQTPDAIAPPEQTEPERIASAVECIPSEQQPPPAPTSDCSVQPASPEQAPPTANDKGKAPVTPSLLAASRPDYIKEHTAYLDAILPSINNEVAQSVNNTFMTSLAFAWEAKRITKDALEQALGFLTLYEKYRKQEEHTIPSEAAALDALCTLYLVSPKSVFKDDSEHGDIIKASIMSLRTRRFYADIRAWVPKGTLLFEAIRRRPKMFIDLVPHADRYVCYSTQYSDWWAKNFATLMQAPNVEQEYMAEKARHIPVLAVCEAFRTFARKKTRRSDLRCIPRYVLINHVYYTRGPKSLALPMVNTFFYNWDKMQNLDIEITAPNLSRAIRHIQGELDVFTREELSKDKGLAINATEYAATVGLLVRLCPEIVAIWYELAMALSRHANEYPPFTETELADYTELGELLLSEKILDSL